MAPNFLDDDQQKRPGQPAPYNPSGAIASGQTPLAGDSGGTPEAGGWGGQQPAQQPQQPPQQPAAPPPQQPAFGAPTGNAQQAAGGMQSALSKPNLPSPAPLGGMPQQQPQQPQQQRQMGRRYYGEQKQF